MIFAQISDIHLDLPDVVDRHGNNTGQRLQSVVERLNTLPLKLQFVLISGDLVSTPDRAHYNHLHTILEALTVPYFLMVGNHDDRKILCDQFIDHSYLHSGFVRESGFVQYEIQLSNDSSKLCQRRIVITDTLDKGVHSGFLCDVRLTWLRNILTACSETPTIVALHHPPFLTGIPGIDKYNLVNSDIVMDVLRCAPGVLRIISGHVHRNVELQNGSLVASTCPAVGVTFSLDPDPSGNRVTYLNGPAGFQLHNWNDDGTVITHTVYI
jgi:3',5'-cyclic AMP phosphodiesterase CpdA